jgi:Integral membrane protein TerC family
MEWISWVSDPNAWVSLAVLTLLEIVLGIDNVIFISILASKLPPGQQAKARSLGLAFALISRILLLLSIKWLVGLTTPLGAVFGHEFSGKDLILFAGGLFLIAKSTLEIHAKLEEAVGGALQSSSIVFELVVALDLRGESVVRFPDVASNAPPSRILQIQKQRPGANSPAPFKNRGRGPRRERGRLGSRRLEDTCNARGSP